MRAMLPALFAGCVLSVSACSDHTGPSNTPPTLTDEVNVVDDAFVSPTARVLAGGTVTWTWQGDNQHNVTFQGGAPASATQTDGTYERTFPTAGNFPYQCTIHGQSMSGTVVVVAEEPAE